MHYVPAICLTECGREAALLPTELDGDVHGECVRGGVGAGGGVRARRMGEHDQLHQAGEHLRALRQVLPVPQAAATTRRRPAAAPPLMRRLGCPTQLIA